MQIDISGINIPEEDRERIKAASIGFYDKLQAGKEDYTGWVKLPYEFDGELLEDIKTTAEDIKSKCSLFVVIGIGGSFLGAKAVTDALSSNRPDGSEVVFAGFNMSAAYLDRLIKRIKTESACICVISKSGSTVESMLSYSILKEVMFAKYGYREARRRIYVITDEKKGNLRQDAFENQFKSFVVPDDIGGRYSVLSVVGLLPIAVSGSNIDTILGGAREIALSDKWRDGFLDYTIARTALAEAGKTVEIFEYFEADMRYFGEWLKQLFGETEGKDGKGIYPACLCFSRDLHSMGQFLQQGHQIFFETMIKIRHANCDLVIPWHAGYPYAGKTLEQINECSEKGVTIAHQKAGIPVISIELSEMNEHEIGKLIYFFEMSCALCAYNTGVNPFDQPGVENYKSEMRKLIEKL